MASLTGPHQHVPCLFRVALLGLPFLSGLLAEDLDEQLQKAFRDAAIKVSPSIVMIETAGGLDRVGKVLKGQGPTTGVVIAEDGYIVTSAFNFAHKPASILVSLPGGKRLPAKLVATDFTRMVTLLKIQAGGLRVPEPAASSALRVGQWTIALGRSWGGEVPAISVGILSATRRIWGKAVQTDAKVSPSNYGGPLVDIRGHVIGVVVPLSPTGEGETVGFEWYDSGIGFAVTFEDIVRALPRLKQGTDLKRGLLGILLKGNLYESKVAVEKVSYKSPAAEAGMEKGDLILDIDGQPLQTQADLRYVMATKYGGDEIAVKVRRGEDELTLKCKLVDELPPYERPMLGILPARSVPKGEKGARVRAVLPGTAAAELKLQAGDRVLKFKDKDVANSASLARLVWGSQPEEIVKLEVARGEETLKLEAALQSYSSEVPEELAPEEPLPEEKEAPAEEKNETEGKAATTSEEGAQTDQKGAPAEKKAEPERKEGETHELELEVPGLKAIPVDGEFKLEQKTEGKEKGKKAAEAKKPEEPKKAKTGEIRKTLKKQGRTYWAYIPPSYDPKRPMTLFVWLHPSGAALEKEVIASWKRHADERNFCVMGPLAGNVNEWSRTDASFVGHAIGDLAKTYKVDLSRIVAHGHGDGASLALDLLNTGRARFRSLIASDLPRRGQVPPVNPGLPRSFFLLSAKDSRSAKATAEMRKVLHEKRHPTLYRELPSSGPAYLPADIVDLAARWIDSLDRI